MTECFLHKKKVLIDLPYVDVGLQTRYNDCMRDLQSLDLREGDKILQIIEQSK